MFAGDYLFPGRSGRGEESVIRRDPASVSTHEEFLFLIMCLTNLFMASRPALQDLLLLHFDFPGCN